MAILTVYDEQFPCSVAMKGDDYIRLLDEEGNIVFFADGITDFSPYILDGSWEYPYKRSATIVSCTAALVNGVLTLTPKVPTKIESFATLGFQAPCDCNMFASLSICDKTYDVVDAMGKSIVGGSGGAWCKNAYVSLMIDHVNKKAYVLNAATSTAPAHTHSANDIVSDILYISRGGTGANTKSDALYNMMFSRNNLGGGNGAIDFDNLAEYGNCWINITDNDVNPPGGLKFGNYGRFDNFPSHQKFWQYGTGKVWQRFHANGAWQPWYCIGGDDYVVAQGQSGDWLYRKWNSGYAECWNKISYSIDVKSNTSVNLWFNNNFPFAFTGSPTVVFGQSDIGGTSHWFGCMSANSTTLRYSDVLSFATGNATGTAHVYCYGKWK